MATVAATGALPAPYPRYESCPPINNNILLGDDSNYLPFMPFADDPTFDYHDYLADHKGLAWQEGGYRDSDVLAIVLETARRLQREHGMSMETIDKTGILPLTLCTTSVWGAIWTEKMSDRIPWPGSSRASAPALSDITPPAADDLKTRLQDYLTLWCPRLECLQGHCFTHATEQHNIDFAVPAVPGQERFRLQSAQTPCGNDCTLRHRPIHERDVAWSDADLEELRVICHIAPPTTPCELARLCHKPCFEVAVVAPRVSIKRKKGRPKDKHDEPQDPQYERHLYGTEVPPHFIPNKPCNHPGPCIHNGGCACAANAAHCSRSCGCSALCARRWKGCKCATMVVKQHKRGPRELMQPCSTDYCPCRKAKRECDPEVCAPCPEDSSCRNMQLQRGVPKRVEVKQSKHGMGLFLAEAVHECDLIIEYVGELIYEATFQTRNELSQHLGRNYVFGLNDQISVDSTRAGNPARFINHAPARRANVEVSILLVDGEQRIGVYAKRQMAPGTELLLDYGPEFPITGAES
ncbi:SET domain-containing protein [Lentinus tigrinus ALCF2SS1-6]|uniref:SET domain-containing protein n=2 Tax=Lentinus tigrinus TaxID=5365 RepID=A0A5C2RRX7_9APHY|nr:SET domain-containing protein [Lentinus tigrinus ALCF2SS1-6]